MGIHIELYIGYTYIYISIHRALLWIKLASNGIPDETILQYCRSSASIPRDSMCACLHTDDGVVWSRARKRSGLSSPSFDVLIPCFVWW